MPSATLDFGSASSSSGDERAQSWPRLQTNLSAHQVGTVAPTGSTALIQGETATGKELIATAIHAESNRHNRPMIKLNRAVIPAELPESFPGEHMATPFPTSSSDNHFGQVRRQFKGSGPITTNKISIDKLPRVRSGDPVEDSSRFSQIVGNSPSLEAVLEQVQCVAPTGSTVLIQGETGTGKELIAHAIHNLSSRSGRAFVIVNCAAIPPDLLESELFGHEKGAFTGAIAQRIGRFEIADSGTLFLDEVGDIPPALQPKLLRVLQEQEFERLGSTRTQHVDVRVVAATHRNLTDMVGRREFRSDLYYRLNVFPVLLPPLRARREDIHDLVWHFVEKFGRRMGKKLEHISADTMSALTLYEWPGNIRELQNMIERAMILSDDGVLPNPLPSPWDSERAIVLQALEQADWVIGGPKGAATRLGLKRTTLISKMRKLAITRH